MIFFVLLFCLLGLSVVNYSSSKNKIKKCYIKSKSIQGLGHWNCKGKKKQVRIKIVYNAWPCSSWEEPHDKLRSVSSSGFRSQEALIVL